MEITGRQREIILGSMLGDGCIHKNGMLMFGHSEKQLDWLTWKRNEMIELSKKIYQEIKIIDKKNYTSYRFGTSVNQYFKDLENIWYKRNLAGDYIFDKKGWRIKLVPKDLILTPLMIAVWYFDDGTNNSHENGRLFEFCTDNFTKRECNFLSKQLNDFNIGSYVYDYNKKKKSKGFRIRICGIKDCLKFRNLIIDQIPLESMQYKFEINENFQYKNVMAPEGLGWCSKCEQYKNLNCFTKHKQKYNGHSNTCKECFNAGCWKNTIAPLGQAWCGTCEIYKDVSLFNKASRNHNGLRSTCRECQKIEKMIYRKKKAKKLVLA